MSGCSAATLHALNVTTKGAAIVSFQSRHRGNITLKHLTVVAILIAASTTLKATESTPLKVKLGDATVDGTFLKPYKNVWKVVYAFPGKEPFLMGTWSDELSPIEVNGR